MSLQLTGIHHLTAITANAPGNLRFYTRTLGLRLVKKTVNQDDTSAYHLFYADAEATPGTDLTFFDWPVGRERRGTNSIVRTSLRVASPESLAWWKQNLSGETVATGEIGDIAGYPSLDFEDPEGQRLRLVSDGGKGDSHPWAQSPIPIEHQIRGLGPIVISVPDITNTETVLTRVMNMRKARDYASPDGQGQVHVFEMGKAARRRSFMSRCSRALRRHGRAPVRSTTSHSGRRTRRPCINGRRGWPSSACRQAVRSNDTTFARSTSVSRTAYCSRSPPTAQDSRPTSRWKRWAKGWPCRRSSNRNGLRSRPASSRWHSALVSQKEALRQPTVMLERRAPFGGAKDAPAADSTHCPFRKSISICRPMR
ncbi:Glyoxalase family protein [Mesorhizobium ventifaucium]|uniref:Glyoxalase family protein n=1 Tax=Mesorhizobium ventifaucium TaxID=666020 RepID=A0ABM9EBX8_9HYPH|nr:Glyoxalase family protein [Mesorhizobium ventifaucium]